MAKKEVVVPISDKTGVVSMLFGDGIDIRFEPWGTDHYPLKDFSTDHDAERVKKGMTVRVINQYVDRASGRYRQSWMEIVDPPTPTQ